ncbi:aminopeptidase [candidate division WWE3 bacterium]|nr:aminopeptidase [candidate division WWE3 bacterium]
MQTLQNGARNVIKLTHFSSQDRMIIITDDHSATIATQIEIEANLIGAVKPIRIEDFSNRPTLTLPDAMINEIREFKPTVSIYAAQGLEGELPGFRHPLLDLLIKELNCRHAHMINIDEQLMKEGMNADYDRVAEITNALHQLLLTATSIRVTSSDGTNIKAIVDPKKYKWVVCTGSIENPGTWTNLPDGEIFTTPVSVSGLISARVLGDYFGHQYGILAKPIHVTIQDSRIVSATHPDQQLVNEFLKYVKAEANNDRVGEFAIGTNIGLDHLTGNLLQDEKYPGLHIAFGHPFPDQTGATWDAPGHIDLVSPNTSIWIGDKMVMEEGKFLL